MEKRRVENWFQPVPRQAFQHIPNWYSATESAVISGIKVESGYVAYLHID